MKATSLCQAARVPAHGLGAGAGHFPRVGASILSTCGQTAPRASEKEAGKGNSRVNTLRVQGLLLQASLFK